MKLENQVVSLELARKLKELGVKQESLFYWSQGGIYNEGTDWQVCYASRATRINGEELDWYSAFTVAELGEMLPHVLKKEDKLYYLQCNANGNSLCYTDYTTYDSNGNGTFLRAYPLAEADTEADARAKMLIYLIENKLVDPISSNER